MPDAEGGAMGGSSADGVVVSKGAHGGEGRMSSDSGSYVVAGTEDHRKKNH